MISLQAASDGSAFLLLDCSGQSALYKLTGSSVVGTYPFEMSSFATSFAIDGANNIYTIYHNQLIMTKVYYDVRPLSDPALPVFYTKTFLDTGAVFNGKHSCAATKIPPYYFYTFAAIIDSAETNVSLMRLSPDEKIRNIMKLSSNMWDVYNYKMACAPDGTLYVAFAKSVGTNNMITIWRMN